jgi:hypothetical protein
MCRTKHPLSSVRRNLHEAVWAPPKGVVKVLLAEDLVLHMIVGVVKERLQVAAEVQVISEE